MFVVNFVTPKAAAKLKLSFYNCDFESVVKNRPKHDRTHFLKK